MNSWQKRSAQTGRWGVTGIGHAYAACQLSWKTAVPFSSSLTSCPLCQQMRSWQMEELSQLFYEAWPSKDHQASGSHQAMTDTARTPGSSQSPPAGSRASSWPSPLNAWEDPSDNHNFHACCWPGLGHCKCSLWAPLEYFSAKLAWALRESTMSFVLVEVM